MAPGTLKYMSDELTVIRSEMVSVEEQFFDSVDDLPETTRASARNLLHYLALRRHDLSGAAGIPLDQGRALLQRTPRRCSGGRPSAATSASW